MKIGIKKKPTTIIITVILVLTVGTAGIFASNIIISGKNLNELKDMIPDSKSSIKSIEIDENNNELQQMTNNKQLMNINKQIDDYNTQINNLKKQSLILERDNSILNLNKGFGYVKIANQKLIEKYNLQVDYYNVCLLKNQKELMNSQLEYIKLALDIEQTKYQQGNSTEINVRDISNQKTKLEISINDLDNTIKAKIDNIKNRLAMLEEDVLDPIYEIPVLSPTSLQYSINDLTSQCLNKNVDYLMINNQKVAQNEYITKLKLIPDNFNEISIANNLLSKLELQDTDLKTEISSYIKIRFNEYNKLVLQMNSLFDMKTNIDAKKAVIEEKFQQGLISELDYKMQMYDLNKQLYDINIINVEYQNSKTRIDAINEGVYMK